MIISNADMDYIIHQLKPFLNEELKLIKMPSKYKKQLMAIYYLASKFQPNKQYTEFEVNEVICSWHTFQDQATFRRGLVDMGFLDRTSDCKTYWLNDIQIDLADFISDKI